MAWDNISYMDARRFILRNQNRLDRDKFLIKDKKNFPQLNPDNLLSKLPTYADTTKTSASSSIPSSILAGIKELNKILTSTADPELLLQRLFQTINLHRKALHKDHGLETLTGSSNNNVPSS